MRGTMRLATPTCRSARVQGSASRAIVYADSPAIATVAPVTARATTRLFANADGKRSTDFGRYETCSKMGPLSRPPEMMSRKFASVTSRGSNALMSRCRLFSDCRLPSRTGTNRSTRHAIATRFALTSATRAVRDSRTSELHAPIDELHVHDREGADEQRKHPRR